MILNSKFGTINYFDLVINRDKNDLNLGRQRKPTHSNITMRFTSNHPMQHKLTEYRHLIHRMYILSITDTRKEKERNNYIEHGENDGFPLRIIHKVENNIVHRTQQEILQNKRKNVFCLHTTVPSSRKLPTSLNK